MVPGLCVDNRKEMHLRTWTEVLGGELQNKMLTLQSKYP